MKTVYIAEKKKTARATVDGETDMKSIGRIIKQNRFWLGLIGLLDVFSILLLWLADSRSFRKLIIAIVLFSLLVFTAAVCYLVWKTRRREKAFEDFLTIPDRYHQEKLLQEAGDLQSEINRFSDLLYEQTNQCGKLKLQLEDYEEYVEAWAHEGKTPLALLTFMLDNHRDELPENVRCRLEYINCKLQNSIEQMLYYARLKGARKDYRFEPVLIVNCVDTVLDDYAALIEEQRIQIHTDIKEKTVFTDKRGFTFMLGQFISNAVKYSNGDLRQIWITAFKDKQQERIVCSIRDNGIGIKACDLPYVFEKGFTGDSGDRQKKATGMGLYLAHELAHDLNAELRIASDEVIGGCEVRVYFPVVDS